MIPRTISEWSIDAILGGLLSARIDEAEEFDFKKMLPHPKDEGEKVNCEPPVAPSRIASAVISCSESTTSVQGSRRIALVGLDAALDFPERFGNYPKQCTPSVHWTFRNPPLRLVFGPGHPDRAHPAELGARRMLMVMPTRAGALPSVRKGYREHVDGRGS